MWTIYLDLSVACLTIGLAYLHKQLTESPVSVRELIHEEDRNEDNEIKMSA